MNCGNCACTLSEEKMTFEIENEDKDLVEHRLCANCFDDKDEEDVLVAVWKFGTSVGVDEDEEFDVNDYKDYMFASGDDEGSDCESECDDEEEEDIVDKVDTLINNLKMPPMADMLALGKILFTKQITKQINNDEMVDLIADLKRCDVSDIYGGHFECDEELDELQMRKWAFLETLEKESNTTLSYLLFELSEMYDRRTGRYITHDEEEEEDDDDE